METDNTDLTRLIKTLLHHRAVIVLSTVLVAGSALLTSMYQKPTYQASSVLMMRPQDMGASVLFGSILSQYGIQPDQPLAIQSRLIVVRPILEKTIDILKLKDTPEQLRNRVDVVSDVKANMLTVNVKAGSAYQAKLINKTLINVYLDKNKKSSVNQVSKAARQVNMKLKNTEEEIIALAKKTANYPTKVPDDMRAKLDMAVNLYGMLAEKNEQLNIFEGLQTSEAELVAPAIEPDKPISPQPFRNVILGLFAGIVAGVLLALGLEELDNKIKTSEDVEDCFGLPVIGKIPLDTDIAKGTEVIVVQGGVTTPTAEAFRTIRTNLEFFSAGKPIQTLMVTSGKPRDGKSLFALNAAAAFAQTGMRVLLVGCDLRIPSIHEKAGLANEIGLSTYLGGYTNDVDSIVKPTEIENLRMIVSGPKPPNPAELLGSDRMIELVKQLRSLADFIVFDTPPVLSVADANVVSRYADGAVLIYDYAQTTREDAKRTADALSNTEVRQLGVVMNKIPAKGAGSHYYYDQYYVSGPKYPEKAKLTVA